MMRLTFKPRKARRLRIAADRIDLPAIARVAQDDVSDEGRQQKDDDGHGNRSDLPLPPPGERRLKARYRAAGGEKQGRAAERRHAAKRHHEGRHLEPGDGEALEVAAGEPDSGRRQRGQAPAVADTALADGETVVQAALGDDGRHQSGEGEQRADREIDAGGQNHEGHADREQAGDRHLPHHVEEVDRGEEPRFDDGEQHHQRDEEQGRREARDEAEDVDASILGRFQPRLAHAMSPFKPPRKRRRYSRALSSSPSGFPASPWCARFRR